MAFFITGDAALIQNAQASTPEYRIHQEKISALRDDIRRRELLVERQLSSRYHDQWRAGEEQLKTIADQQRVLSDALGQGATPGNERALAALPTQQLFVAIATIFSGEAERVRLAAFALLALLLEVSALAAISLSGAAERVFVSEPLSRSPQQPLQPSPPSPREPSVPLPDAVSESDQLAQLVRDIVRGRIEPVVRKIVAARYGINLALIRETLDDLKRQGILDDDIRNSYKLSAVFMDPDKALAHEQSG